MRIASLLLYLCLFAIHLPLTAQADDLRWATATKGGGFQLFGQHAIAAINAQDPDLGVVELPSKGSRQNLRLLQSGEADIGQVEGNAARIALEGIGTPKVDLKVLAVMYPNPGMFVVPTDSPATNIDHLKGQPIAFGTQASGLRILARDVLSGLDLDPEKDFQQIILGKAADGPRLVLDGKAAALWGAGIGWPGFVAVADSPAGARFIAPSSAQIERIRTHHPHLQPMTVPAHTYTGQTQPIDSVGLWSLILVRPDLDDAIAYRLARALHLAQPQLAGELPQAGYTTPDNTLRYVGKERLHPGAARYLGGLETALPD